jgi:hypothetical protein
MAKESLVCNVWDIMWPQPGGSLAAHGNMGQHGGHAYCEGNELDSKGQTGYSRCLEEWSPQNQTWMVVCGLGLWDCWQSCHHFPHVLSLHGTDESLEAQDPPRSVIRSVPWRNSETSRDGFGNTLREGHPEMLWVRCAWTSLLQSNVMVTLPVAQSLRRHTSTDKPGQSLSTGALECVRNMHITFP